MGRIKRLGLSARETISCLILGFLLGGLAAVMPGCAINTNLTGDAKLEIAKIAARRAGYTIAQHQPAAEVDVYIGYCDAVLKQEDAQIPALAAKGLDYLIEHYSSDPLIIEDLASIATICGIDFVEIEAPVAIDPAKTETVVALVKAIRTGLKYGGK